MKCGPLILLGGFFSLVCSWGALVLAPVVQLGTLGAHQDQNTGVIYPVTRPGLAQQGAEVYRALGCNQCHTRFVTQETLGFGARLNKASTNTEQRIVEQLLDGKFSRTTNELRSVVLALQAINPGLDYAGASELLNELPEEVLDVGGVFEAQRAVELLKRTGSEAGMTVWNQGPDLNRGWGARRSVARDYLYDPRMLAGRVRVGPDLANLGERLPEDFTIPWEFSSDTNTVMQLHEREQWLFTHLYNPRLHSPEAMMPAYPFLFEHRAAGGGFAKDSPNVVELADGRSEIEAVVPTPAARALVAWLLSQTASAALPEAPVAVAEAPAAPISTNAPPAVAPAKP